jgi:hypothetical protein
MSLRDVLPLRGVGGQPMVVDEATLHGGESLLHSEERVVGLYWQHSLESTSYWLIRFINLLML